MIRNNSKIQIYKGIIQYLLDSTNYTLKNIADLSGSPINNIRSIYCHDVVPVNFTSETRLVRLYQLVLDIHIKEKQFERYLPLPKGFSQIYASQE